MPLGDIAGQVLTRNDLEAVTALGMIDVLKGGSTTLMDMWFHGQDAFFEVFQRVIDLTDGDFSIEHRDVLGALMGADGDDLTVSLRWLLDQEG
jgi:hypothetical protein